MNPPEHRALIDTLKELLGIIGPDKGDRLITMGLELGFLPDWLKKQKKHGAKRMSVADRMIEIQARPTIFL
jgi:hypothetical protein